MFEMYSDIGVHRDNTPDVMMGDRDCFVKLFDNHVYELAGVIICDNIDKANRMLMRRR